MNTTVNKPNLFLRISITPKKFSIRSTKDSDSGIGIQLL
jgi:hypothetical protein